MPSASAAGAFFGTRADGKTVRSTGVEALQPKRQRGGALGVNPAKPPRRRAMSDDPLDQEIDFSKGVRGKFYHKDAEFHVPVYLEPTVLQTLTETANRKVSGSMIW